MRFQPKAEQGEGECRPQLPPAFTRASPTGFALEAPRGAGWDFALSADVKGNASVKLGKEELADLDAKLTADLVVTILPRGQLDLITTEPGPIDVDFDEIPVGKDFRTVMIEWSGALKIGMKKVGKLTLPFKGFDLSIPFPSSQGLNEALAVLTGPQAWGDKKQAPYGQDQRARHVLVHCALRRDVPRNRGDAKERTRARPLDS